MFCVAGGVRSPRFLTLLGVAVLGTLSLPVHALGQDASPSDPATPPAVTGTAGSNGAGGEAAKDADGSESGFLSFVKTTQVSALLDMYFTYNFNEPATGALTPLRNFDSEHNQFNIALAEVALSNVPTPERRVGFRVDLDYGSTAKTVNSFEPGGDTFENVQQGYLSLLAPLGAGLTIDVGKFVTPHGAEVIETQDNWNYSRSLLFALAIPYYHMGARLGYAPNDRVSFGGSITNGWNDVKDNNSQKTFGLSASVKPMAAVSIVGNYMAGPEQPGNSSDWRHLFDTTVSYTINDRLGVMANYDYGRDRVAGQSVSWQGIAVYARAQANAYLAVSPRFELYDDSDGFTTGTAQKVKELTLTAELKHPQGLLLRAEYRRDWSDEDFFEKDGRPAGSQNTFTVGVVCFFKTKAP